MRLLFSLIVLSLSSCATVMTRVAKDGHVADCVDVKNGKLVAMKVTSTKDCESTKSCTLETGMYVIENVQTLCVEQ
jgi:hypothetical protein